MMCGHRAWPQPSWSWVSHRPCSSMFLTWQEISGQAAMPCCFFGLESGFLWYAEVGKRHCQSMQVYLVQNLVLASKGISLMSVLWWSCRNLCAVPVLKEQQMARGCKHGVLQNKREKVVPNDFTLRVGMLKTVHELKGEGLMEASTACRSLPTMDHETNKKATRIPRLSQGLPKAENWQRQGFCGQECPFSLMDQMELKKLHFKGQSVGERDTERHGETLMRWKELRGRKC